jgi:DNA-3-methyladenine glycosylase II
MSHRIDTEADIAAGLAALTAADPRLVRLAEVAGPLPLRRRAGGFAGLASIVVSQQLSTASAAAIWRRLSAAFDPLDHESIRRARTAKLQRVGLSAPKIRTLKAIAKAIHSGAIDFTALDSMAADDAHAMLTATHGIGPWTADIYLLFCVGHADAWPAGDLALQEAARIGFALAARPRAQEMIALAERWRPWRGVAARLLWTYYRAVKGRDAAPVQPTA